MGECGRLNNLRINRANLSRLIRLLFEKPLRKAPTNLSDL
jgi:hypothetical protein